MSSSQVSAIYKPHEWISGTVIALISFIISGSLLQSELRQRRSGSITFTSRFLGIFSAATLWAGIIVTLLLALKFVPAFCFMERTAPFIAITTQFMFMGFYQLSKLYYCFSNNQIHARNGYPLWIFIVMITFGIMLNLSMFLLFTISWQFPTRCGYKSDFTFFSECRHPSVLFNGNWAHDQHLGNIRYFWFYPTLICGLFWDICTLLLYLYKIIGIAKIHQGKVRFGVSGMNVQNRCS